VTDWPRDRYIRKVWESDDLPPLARLVALAYADHARDQPTAWVTFERLRDCTGLSRDAANRALRKLVETGWLTVHEAGTRRRSAVYRLTVPAVDNDRESVSRTLSVRETDAESTSPGAESPGDGSHYSADLSKAAAAGASGIPLGPSGIPYAADDVEGALRWIATANGAGSDEELARAVLADIITARKAGPPADLSRYVRAIDAKDLGRRIKRMRDRIRAAPIDDPCPAPGCAAIPQQSRAGWIEDANGDPMRCPQCKGTARRTPVAEAAA
jgi:hypothetical protein